MTDPMKFAAALAASISQGLQSLLLTSDLEAPQEFAFSQNFVCKGLDFRITVNAHPLSRTENDPCITLGQQYLDYMRRGGKSE